MDCRGPLLVPGDSRESAEFSVHPTLLSDSFLKFSSTRAHVHTINKCNKNYLVLGLHFEICLSFGFDLIALG